MLARIRTQVGWTAALCLASTLAGCGGGRSATGTPEPATVKGTVSVKGKHPAHARVNFNPSSLGPGMKARSVDVKPDGTFAVDLASGPYSVAVRSPAIDRNPALETNSKLVEIKAGENSIPIEL